MVLRWVLWKVFPATLNLRVDQTFYRLKFLYELWCWTIFSGERCDSVTVPLLVISFINSQNAPCLLLFWLNFCTSVLLGANSQSPLEFVWSRSASDRQWWCPSRSRFLLLFFWARLVFLTANLSCFWICVVSVSSFIFYGTTSMVFSAVSFYEWTHKLLRLACHSHFSPVPARSACQVSSSKTKTTPPLWSVHQTETALYTSTMNTVSATSAVKKELKATINALEIILPHLWTLVWLKVDPNWELWRPQRTSKEDRSKGCCSCKIPAPVQVGIAYLSASRSHKTGWIEWWTRHAIKQGCLTRLPVSILSEHFHHTSLAMALFFATVLPSAPD